MEIKRGCENRETAKLTERKKDYNVRGIIYLNSMRYHKTSRKQMKA
jgi:hypothetical protein